MANKAVYGGIEAGGTKFICAFGSCPDDLGDETRIETTTPDETLGRVVDLFRPAVQDGRVSGIGVACFGPLDLDPSSATYGFITSTPKPGWSNTDIVGKLSRELGIPVVLDTDVDGAGLAESVWGAGKGIDPLLYLTIGTGIGGGFVQGGRPLHGMLHPEDEI